MARLDHAIDRRPACAMLIIIALDLVFSLLLPLIDNANEYWFKKNTAEAPTPRSQDAARRLVRGRIKQARGEIGRGMMLPTLLVTY